MRPTICSEFSINCIYFSETWWTLPILLCVSNVFCCGLQKLCQADDNLPALPRKIRIILKWKWKIRYFQLLYCVSKAFIDVYSLYKIIMIVFVQVVCFDHICFLFTSHLQIPLFHLPSNPIIIFSFIHTYMFISWNVSLWEFLVRLSSVAYRPPASAFLSLGWQAWVNTCL